MDDNPEQFEESGSNYVHSDDDSFADPLVSLQRVQEALQSEVQKFEEIREDPMLLEVDEGENAAEWDAYSLGDDGVVQVKKKIEDLEFKLEEVSTALRVKNSRVTELEGILQNFSPEMVEERRNMELEAERLFQRNMEESIKCVVMSRVSQSWQFRAEDQISLMVNHDSLAAEHSQNLAKLRDTERHVDALKEHVEELERHKRSLEGRDELLRLQNKAFKFVFAILVQFILVGAALRLVYTQVTPASSVGLMPT